VNRAARVRFTMVWRANLKLQRDIFELSQAVVGGMARGRDGEELPVGGRDRAGEGGGTGDSGASPAMNLAMHPGSRRMTQCLPAPLLREPRKLTAVPVTNKMVRADWAMLTFEAATVWGWVANPIRASGHAAASTGRTPDRARPDRRNSHFRS
jgi:hypothetical protein